MIRAENLTRTVAGRTLVSEVSFDVAERNVLAIVGPSGAGKSSLLRLLNRLDEPTSGTVYLGGQDYRDIPPSEVRRRVGMVMQQPALFPGSAGDNLRYGPRQRGVELSDEVVEELLSAVGLDGYAHQDVSVLSGGEGQRVCLARALANDPEVLLMDEPTSALDPDAKAGIEELIRDVIVGRGLTCVIVTHDNSQALRLANRALVLEAGRMVALGPITEVVHA